MAIELRFTCVYEPKDFVSVKSHRENNVTIWIQKDGELKSPFTFDIPTAIKLAKTLRTEINKAKEGGQNG